MKFELTVTEFKEMFNSLQSPHELLELLRVDFSNQVGIYLSKLMKAELSEHLGREPYERSGNHANHRNGFYQRKITLKGIGEVEPQVPRDRQGTYQTQVLPRSKRYEQAIAEDLSLMFLSGISTHSLALLSKRLIGRSISHTEISLVNRELQEAAETWRERDLSEDWIPLQSNWQ